MSRKGKWLGTISAIGIFAILGLAWLDNQFKPLAVKQPKFEPRVFLDEIIVPYPVITGRKHPNTEYFYSEAKRLIRSQNFLGRSYQHVLTKMVDGGFDCINRTNLKEESRKIILSCDACSVKLEIGSRLYQFENFLAKGGFHWLVNFEFSEPIEKRSEGNVSQVYFMYSREMRAH